MPLADAVVLSSEHPAQEQLDFFNADMATLNRMRTPWVLAMLHRPLFGSDPLDAIDHGPSFAYSLPMHAFHTRRDRVASFDNMPFAWRGHTKSLATRARLSPALVVWLE